MPCVKEILKPGEEAVPVQCIHGGEGGRGMRGAGGMKKDSNGG
jgi:hypothetical protein